MYRYSLALLLFSLPWIALAAARADHPGFNVHDLVNLKRISSPQISPDGKDIVFVLRTTDLEANRGRTDLWRVGVDGAGLQRLTSHEAGDSNPRWAPDGKGIFFLSSRSGSSQVWRLPMGPGEAEQVTHLPLDVGGFELSPDGKNLAVALEVFVDCADLACTNKRLKEREAVTTTGVAYDQLFFRHWDTWKDGRRSHLFVVPVAGGTPVDVSKGLDGDVPSKPFGGTEEMTFTPDSKGVVFAARTSGREEAWSTDFDLYHSPIDGSSKPRNLTPDNGAWITLPQFSPDGKTLYFAAMTRPGFEADRFRLMARAWPDGKARVIAEDWDRSVADYFFSPDGKTAYITVQDTGNKRLFAVDTKSGKVKPLTSEGTVRSASLAGERLIVALDHLRSPVDLYSIALDGTDGRQLTEINGEAMAKVALGEPEQFSFPGWNDETVYGWVVKPANFEAGKKYPVAFLIHGGPQGSFSNNFHYRWNPQTYAGAGYAAVMIDFHGSTGYGQAFTDSISGDWGGKPLEDLQKGLAAAVERYDFLDGDRVSALGASYGGYMINWIAGNWPDRFRSLVNHDGLFDHRMMYYTTEELWFPEWEHGGGPYHRDPAFAEAHNPANFVNNWKTPMLVVHGALDYRVPETQGFATFTALQRLGIPSRMLYYPDENHWVLKPQNSIQWHEEVLAWLDRWTKKD
ncbi:MAG: S9 family peptidase [Deltaproteobacteria bacterium]|nr:S9 family peptidase [Deltaproteobacteria bacterium]